MAEQRWSIPEETLKVAFDKLEIDEKYYPIFSKRANKALNDVADGFAPEKDDTDYSLERASEFAVLIDYLIP